MALVVFIKLVRNQVNFQFEQAEFEEKKIDILINSQNSKLYVLNIFFLITIINYTYEVLKNNYIFNNVNLNILNYNWLINSKRRSYK